MNWVKKYSHAFTQKISGVKLEMDKTCLIVSATLIIFGGYLAMHGINKEAEAEYERCKSFNTPSSKHYQLKCSSEGSKAMALTAFIGSFVFLGLGLSNKTNKQKSR